MKITKQKINIRERLASLLNFNQMLGGLKQIGVNVDDQAENTLQVQGGLGVDDLDMMSTHITRNYDPVHITIYDTKRDSDGGHWRSRMQHTSWYKESLGTAYRGTRREFPSVAVILIEEYRVIILDGDSPQLDMWMIFEYGAGRLIRQETYDAGLKRGDCMNGVLCLIRNQSKDTNGDYLGTNHSYGFIYINFLDEVCYTIWRKNFRYQYQFSGNISQRNEVHAHFGIEDASKALKENIIFDVAMTVLPESPVNPAMGIQHPTIVLSHDAGIDVIRHDHSVAHFEYSNLQRVGFINNTRLAAGHRGGSQFAGITFDVRDLDRRTANVYGGYIHESQPGWGPSSVSHRDIFGLGDGLVYARGDHGLMRIAENVDSPELGMANFITRDYNTGWMQGQVELAVLMDSTPGQIGIEPTEQVTDMMQTFGDAWTVNLNDGGNFDELTGQYNPNGEFSIRTIAAKEGTSYFRSPYKTPEQLGMKIGQLYDVVIKLRTSQPDVLDNCRVDLHSWGVNELGGQTLIKSQIGHQQPLNTNTTTITMSTRITDQVMWLSWYINAFRVSANQEVIVESISIKPSTNLVVTGQFEMNSNIADLDHEWYKPNDVANDCTVEYIDNSMGPYYNDKRVNDGVHFKITPTGTDNYGIITQKIPVEPNTDYVVTVTSRSGTPGAGPRWFVGTGWGTDHIVYSVYKTSTKDKLTSSRVFNSGSYTQVHMNLGAYGGIAYYDNVSIRPAVADRYKQDTGLQVVGALRKQPVNPGCDVMAYTGFEAGKNYLAFADDDVLDFATGDFSVMGWFKIGLNCVLISHWADNYSDNVSQWDGWNIHTASDGTIFIWTREQTNTKSTPTSGKASRNIPEWQFVTATRQAGKLKIFMNGVLYGESTDGDRTVDIPHVTTSRAVDQPLIIGSLFDPTSSFTSTSPSAVSMVRISKSVPSDQQIARIYADERGMFEPGAKSCLYGDDDVIGDMDYNHSNEQLSLVTNSAINTFQGMIRTDQSDSTYSTSKRIASQQNLTITN